MAVAFKCDRWMEVSLKLSTWGVRSLLIVHDIKVIAEYSTVILSNHRNSTPNWLTSLFRT